MARPDTSEGFVMVALDLFAALMAADLPNRDAIVLAEVLLQTYGPNKPKRGVKAVHLDPAQIEHYTGLHRKNVRRAVHELTEANILHRQTDGSFRFNKDYESWKPGGDPLHQRLGGGILRFAASARTRHGLTIKESENVGIQRESPRVQRDSITVVEQTPVGLHYSCQSESSGSLPNSDATGGRGEEAHAPAHASENLEIREEIEHTQSVSVPTKPKVHIPEYTEEQIREVADRVEQLGGMDFWGSKVRGFARSYPLEWIETAAESAAAKGKDWSYVHGTLKKWYARGAADASTNGDHPSPKRGTFKEKAEALKVRRAAEKDTDAR